MASLTFRDGLYGFMQNMTEWPTATHSELNRIVTSYGPLERMHLAYMEQAAVQQLKALNDPGAEQAAKGDFSAINPANWAAILALIVQYLPSILAIILPLFGGS